MVSSSDLYCLPGVLLAMYTEREIFIISPGDEGKQLFGRGGARAHFPNSG